MHCHATSFRAWQARKERRALPFQNSNVTSRGGSLGRCVSRSHAPSPASRSRRTHRSSRTRWTPWRSSAALHSPPPHGADARTPRNQGLFPKQGRERKFRCEFTSLRACSAEVHTRAGSGCGRGGNGGWLFRAPFEWIPVSVKAPLTFSTRLSFSLPSPAARAL